MSINNKNFFELCNEILEELYFEPVDNFYELDEIAEGRRVKRLLNRALTFICNKEQGNWTFREVDADLVPTRGIKHYQKPNGFIEYMKYPKDNLILSYIDNHKYVTSDTTGMPTSYWMHNDKIRLFPIPDRTYNDNYINIHYLTYDYARDCCGMYKPVMEDETDTPIIPNNNRDTLIYKVCMDWRSNMGDAQSAYFLQQYKTAYRSLLDNCRQTYDLPTGLHLSEDINSSTEGMIQGFNSQYFTSRGNT